MRERAKEFLIALSLANLCFFRVWPDLLNDLSADIYYLKRPPYITEAATVVLWVLVIATVFYVAVALARRTRRDLPLAIMRWLFLGMLLIPLNGLRLQFPNLHSSIPPDLLGPTAKIWIVSLAVLLTAPLLWRTQRLVVRVAKTALLILSPFVLYTFTQALWAPIRHVYANVIDETPAPRLPASETAKQRVVILLFDELDEDAIFSARPATLKLPELDRFLQQAIRGTNVTSVADTTLKALPALLTGKQVSEAQPTAANELLITYSGAGQPVPWSRQANIFTVAREYGVNAALLGWYHPYCRMFGHVLNYCSWEPIATRYGGETNAGWEEKLTWLQVLGGLIDTLPLASRFELRRRLEKTFQIRLTRSNEITQLYIPRYLRMLREAEKLVTDPSLGLILIHWPIPHPPAIHDRQTNDFRRHGRGSYLDNLQLVNRTLATVRASMEESGLWETTAILITSDHPYRDHVWKPVWTREEEEEMSPLDGKIGHRVPFLLKLPNQVVSLTFDRPLSNLVVPDLLVALLSSNDPAKANSVMDWLSQHQKPSTPNA
jgi:Sulfatase